MTAIQLHRPDALPPSPSPEPSGWRVAGPLADWRDDDPEALLRCSVNREHVIRNGDHYAIERGGIRVARESAP